MQKIPLMLAKSGMVLARDVFRGDSTVGMPICGRDTVLTDALITRLDQMDVQSVCVEGHPVWKDGERTYDDMQRELDHRFEKCRRNPLNAMLYDIYRAYLAKTMGGEGGRQTE